MVIVEVKFMELNNVTTEKSQTEMEIELLVYFIRRSDVLRARLLMMTLLGRGVMLTRDIVQDYRQMQSLPS
jgi:hypothetical protein